MQLSPSRQADKMTTLTHRICNVCTLLEGEASNVAELGRWHMLGMVVVVAYLGHPDTGAKHNSHCQPHNCGDQHTGLVQWVAALELSYST
jgi:hypothetical protein